MTDEIVLICSEFENSLKDYIQSSRNDSYKGYFEIIDYQLGWGENGKDKNQGKRVRPVLLLLVMNMFNKDWRKAFSAACALELIHNYSLIHDDIEDKSTIRRGKETIWVKWGEAQAINAGDAMINLAFLAPWKLEDNFNQKIVNEVEKSIQKYSLELTKGQFLDIDFELHEKISIEDYFHMVNGKTGALLQASFEIAGILSEVDDTVKKKLNKSAEFIGRAYQIQDDWLGIWGNEALIGKSNKSDLLERKKTYPVLLGLENQGKFAEIWKGKNKFSQQDITQMASILEEEGIKHQCEEEFNQTFKNAIQSINEIDADTEKKNVLVNYLQNLLKRKF